MPTVRGETRSGGNGRLGNGDTVIQPLPVKVATDDGNEDSALPADAKVTAISAGAFHTCAVTDTGAAYCWGAGSFGQLGNGDTSIQESLPVAVSPPA
jgi:alpha-tubulin suppressor-like RCC1 family protein